MVDVPSTADISAKDVETPQLEKIKTWQTLEESQLPNSGYGWVVITSIFLINAHSWGMTSVSLTTFLHSKASLTN